MGRAIAQLARETEGVSLRGVIDLRGGGSGDRGKGGDDPLQLRAIPERAAEGEVVVDFSRAGAVAPLVKALSGTGFPVVCGTTGLHASERVLLEAYSKNSPVFYDENMSYGISVLKKLLRFAAPLFHNRSDVEIVEFHHREKADFPSGTALSLARALDSEAETVTGRGEFAHPGSKRIHIHPVRLGGVAGEHQIHVGMPEETLMLSHRALSRAVFARGAILAARFVSGRERGFFTMDDLVEESGNV